MVKVDFINPLHQFGKIDYTMIIEYDGTVVFRQDFSFQENITDAELQEFAQKKVEELSTPTFTEVVTDEFVSQTTKYVENSPVIQDKSVVTVVIQKPLDVDNGMYKEAKIEKNSEEKKEVKNKEEEK